MKTSRLSRMKMSTKDRFIGMAFVMPWVVGFLLFTLYPTVFSFALSFNEYQLHPDGAVMNWQGLYYYNQVLNVDLHFKLNLSSSLLFVACASPIVLVFSLIIAILLNGKYPMRTLFRVVFFMPVIIMSGPVIGRLLSRYTTDFSANSPQIFQFINAMPGFIGKPVLTILNNLVLILWFSGVQILIMLAGLQKIDPDIYHAADIDGAGAWEKFWKITLPYMGPLLLVCALYTVIDVANYANNAVNTQIRNSVFLTSGLYSFASAMSWIYFACILLLLGVVFVIFTLFTRRRRHDKN